MNSTILWEHGTLYGYRTAKCKCDQCRGANADDARRLRNAMRRRRTLIDGVWVANDAIHGVLSTYTNRLCRCAECKKTHAEYWRDKRNRATKTAIDIEMET